MTQLLEARDALLKELAMEILELEHSLSPRHSAAIAYLAALEAPPAPVPSTVSEEAPTRELEKENARISKLLGEALSDRNQFYSEVCDTRAQLDRIKNPSESIPKMQNLDLDELLRRAVGIANAHGGDDEEIILALIARLRAAEAQLKEYRELESGQ